MDEEKYWEQPEDLTLDSVEVSEDKTETQNVPKELEGSLEEVEEQKSEAENGETVGKFKDANALLEAYNNLEKEFTKKCQRLSALEKDKVEEDEALNKQVDEKLSLFLSTNGEATTYKEELIERVKNDDSLKKWTIPSAMFGQKWYLTKLRTKKPMRPSKTTF